MAIDGIIVDDNNRKRRSADNPAVNDVFSYDGTDITRIAIGTNGQVFQVAGGVAAWAAGDGLDGDALHDNVNGEINAVALKATPVGADIVVIEDSAATFAKKRATVSSIQGVGSGDNVSVNNSSATDANFDDVDPVQPTGMTNVLWLKDGASPNNISCSYESPENASNIILHQVFD